MKIDNILDENLVRRNLILASLLLSSFETLKSAIEDRILGFFSFGESYFDKDGNFRVKKTDHFKAEVLEKYANEVKGNDDYRLFSSCCLWLRENEVITDDDRETISQIRRQRNLIAHELVRILFEDHTELNASLIRVTISLVEKIELWWVLNVEVPSDEQYDGVEVKPEDVETGMKTLLEYLATIVQLETEAQENSTLVN
jgi:uncharacterized protein YutE (UPF0331/DUF86 family)